MNFKLEYTYILQMCFLILVYLTGQDLYLLQIQVYGLEANNNANITLYKAKNIFLYISLNIYHTAKYYKYSLYVLLNLIFAHIIFSRLTAFSKNNKVKSEIHLI
jgi:hypothetical protein